MADSGGERNDGEAQKQPSPTADTKLMDAKMPQKKEPGTQLNPEEVPDSSMSNELWNSMSYWYYMQSYYQYYYSVCYFYTYYYWQMLSSSNNGIPGASAGGASPFGFQQQGQNIQAQRISLRPQQATQLTSCEARISSIQKRIIAELLDFFFLFFTKFVVFSIFYNNIEKYTQLQYTLIIDENTSLKQLEEILVQALVYRLMVFVYETIFIVGGLFGSLGGATPGKYFMGLSVVSADSIQLHNINARGEQLVRVTPGGNPGWWRASIRALVKNFSMTFLFPIFITVFFFQHNQTIYDIIAGTAVVENEERHQRQR